MLKPVKNYEAPKLPTLEAARGNSELLKKLPSKWKKQTVAAACMGIVGLSALSGGISLAAGPSELHHGGDGGTPFYFTQPTEQETAAEALARYRAQLETAELSLHAHMGGTGSGPFYMVYFTEQEVSGFIRAMLENAGLDFSAVPPDINVSVREYFNGSNRNLGINLFDEGRNVGISFPGIVAPRLYFDPQKAVEDFEQQYDITVGVFINHGTHVFDGMEFRSIMGSEEYEAVKNAAVAERTDEARQALITALTDRTQRFIDLLYSKGILDSGIKVTLNGTPLSFDTAPVIVNGRTLVPMRTVFEVLGFEVEWRDGTITAVKDGRLIQMQIGISEMQADGRTIALDTAPQIVDGRTLVPLRAIAEATGADVEWDEDTQTVVIRG
jgi:hypothetical protein